MSGWVGEESKQNLSFILGDECGLGELRNPSPTRGDPLNALAQLLAGRCGNGLAVRDVCASKRLIGGVIVINDGFLPSGCRGSGGVENGPGVVNGCFSTCSADITTASRL